MKTVKITTIAFAIALFSGITLKAENMETFTMKIQNGKQIEVGTKVEQSCHTEDIEINRIAEKIEKNQVSEISFNIHEFIKPEKEVNETIHMVK